LDVPEWFDSPDALYDKLRFDGSPAFDAVQAEFDQVFERHAVDRGVLLRHQRLAYTLRLE
jgi:hypothetical protein